MVELEREHIGILDPHKPNPEVWAGSVTLSGVYGANAEHELPYLSAVLQTSDIETLRVGVTIPENSDFVVAAFLLRTYEDPQNDRRERQALDQMFYLMLDGLRTATHHEITDAELEMARVVRKSQLPQTEDGSLFSALRQAPPSHVPSEPAGRMFISAREALVSRHMEELLVQLGKPATSSQTS